MLQKKHSSAKLNTNIDINSEEYIHNKNVMLKKINFLR